MRTVFKSRRTVVPKFQEPVPRALVVENGVIEAVVDYGLSSFDGKIVDFGDSIMMPGLVDTHAHINEPGRTEWEGFVTATKAAAAGGITTVIDMPLNSIPATTSLEALKIKEKSARGACAIDYGFWGGVVPGNLMELNPMIDAGVMGFKCFLCPSGVDEFPPVTEGDLFDAMALLGEREVPLIAHAELESPVKLAGSPTKYSTYMHSRPAEWETQAIQLLIALCRETGCRTHIVHLSTADALPMIEAAKEEGLPFTVETCPHYLGFSAEEIEDGATHFKCAPPIRGRENRERLWQAVKTGLIDFIVSDHSPCTPHLKRMETGDFQNAWGGIAGLQFSMPVVWTEMDRRGFTISDLWRSMSLKTAGFLGLDDRKGIFEKGRHADIVVWNPEAEFTVTRELIHHRHKLTPYLGRKLAGVIEKTFVRGNPVFDKNNSEPFMEPIGKRVSRVEKE